MTADGPGTTLWDDFDSLARSLELQAIAAHPVQAGVYTEDAKRIRQILDRWVGTADGRPSQTRDYYDQDGLGPYPNPTAPITETRPTPLLLRDELMDAITKAGDALQLQYIHARNDSSKIAYTGGMFALQELRKALTPQRDGAGTTPSEEPPTEPAPSQPHICPGGRRAMAAPGPNHNPGCDLWDPR